MTTFTKSIKFKMAVWCSTLLLAFSLGFILIINILLTQYMKNFQPLKPLFPNGAIIIKEIDSNEIEIIRESRDNDLKNIRILSLYSAIPLTLLSFVGGYLIAEKTLEPLQKLKEEMHKKGSENLGEEITYEDTKDEISELIASFNSMSKRLSKAFNAQKEFVENASHEIKTPLAIIQANLDAALMDKKISKDELDTLLNECRKSIKFMNTLTEDLLLLSVLDAEIDKEKLNLCDLLDDVKSQVKESAINSEFSIDINCDRSINVSGNRVFLERAFLNIIENSIKYSEGNKLEINVIKKGRDIQMSFKDNGKGISKEYSNKIFERFYRVDRSRSRKSGGSGLGLSITKEIIGKHSGKIFLNKENVKGAEFIIVLPLTK